jgi:outer membrane autotransporter protein
MIVATAMTPQVYAEAVANPDSFTITQGESNASLDVLANDTSTTQSTVYVESWDTYSAQYGSVVAGNSGTLLYSPPSDSYVGTDTFTYTANDDSGYGGSVAVVSVTVEPAPTSGSVKLTPNQQKLAVALDNTCSSLSEGSPASLVAACNATGAERTAVIQQLVPSHLASQGNYSVELQHNLFMNINARLTQLRAGSRGFNANDLSLNIEGEADMTRGLAYLLSNTRGGGASADDSAPSSRLGVFINGSGSFGDRDTTDAELGFDFSTEGLSAGADYRLTDNVVVGGALGYISTGMDFENSQGDQDIIGYSLSAYASWYKSENIYIDGILSYGTNTFDLTRHIQFGTTDTKITGNTDGSEYAISVGGAYELNRGALNFGPFIRVNYINAEVDAFEEDSSSGLELAYDSQDVESLTSLIGGEASYVVSTDYGVVTPTVRFEWAHEYKHDSSINTARFLNDPSSGSFEIGTDNPDRDYFNLGLGVSAVFSQGRSAFLYYETQLDRDDLTKYSLAAGVRFEF